VAIKSTPPFQHLHSTMSNTTSESRQVASSNNEQGPSEQWYQVTPSGDITAIQIARFRERISIALYAQVSRPRTLKTETTTTGRALWHKHRIARVRERILALTMRDRVVFGLHLLLADCTCCLATRQEASTLNRRRQPHPFGMDRSW
jgi:hypothetical protein